MKEDLRQAWDYFTLTNCFRNPSSVGERSVGRHCRIVVKTANSWVKSLSLRDLCVLAVLLAIYVWDKLFDLPLPFFFMCKMRLLIGLKSGNYLVIKHKVLRTGLE